MLNSHSKLITAKNKTTLMKHIVCVFTPGVHDMDFKLISLTNNYLHLKSANNKRTKNFNFVI